MKKKKKETVNETKPKWNMRQWEGKTNVDDCCRVYVEITIPLSLSLSSSLSSCLSFRAFCPCALRPVIKTFCIYACVQRNSKSSRKSAKKLTRCQLPCRKMTFQFFFPYRLHLRLVVGAKSTHPWGDLNEMFSVLLFKAHQFPWSIFGRKL